MKGRGRANLSRPGRDSRWIHGDSRILGSETKHLVGLCDLRPDSWRETQPPPYLRIWGVWGAKNAQPGMTPLLAGPKHSSGPSNENPRNHGLETGTYNVHDPVEFDRYPSSRQSSKAVPNGLPKPTLGGRHYGCRIRNVRLLQ